MVEIVVHHNTWFNHSSAESTDPTFFVIISVAVHIKSYTANFKFLKKVRLRFSTNEFVLKVSSSADFTVLHWIISMTSVGLL